MVMRLPSRSRCTSLPSLTASRPNVDSAMSALRQNSVIWLRISSFFMDGKAVGRAISLRRLSTICPPEKHPPADLNRLHLPIYMMRARYFGVHMVGRFCVAVLLLAALSDVGYAGYTTHNPNEVFESVSARLGPLPVAAARDPSVWLKLEEL